MKARIISTGEIINIADYACVTLDKCDDYGNPIEVPFNDVEIIKEPLDAIDWQQVRIQAAIAAMQGILGNEKISKDVDKTSSSAERVYEVQAIIAVSQADALVKELKGE